MSMQGKQSKCVQCNLAFAHLFIDVSISARSDGDEMLQIWNR